MRSRMIKPGFFENETLAGLPPLTRLVFIGLWLIADREGRMEDRPARIKAQLLPYETWDVKKSIDDLEALGFVVRYHVEGVGYLQICKFKKHQWIHPHEAASIIPACPEKAEQNQCHDIPSNVTGDHVECQSFSLSSSLSLSNSFSSSLSIKETPPTPSKGAARKRKRSAVDCDFSDDFETFWKAYPKKRGKPEAWDAWKALNGTRPPLDVLLDSVRRHAASEEWIKERGQYIPWPQKFLKGCRWMDEIEDRSGQRVSDLTLRNIENAKAVLAERAARRM